MQKTVSELVKRLKKLIGYKNMFVVYHFDIDGCASASILWRIFKKEKINAEFYPITRGFEGVVMDKISKKNPDKIVILDYVPDKDFLKFIKNYKTEIIDHHSFEEALDAFDYFTSATFEVGASLSYLMHKAAEKFSVKDTVWLARLGSFWDKCMEHTEFYYEDVYKKEMDQMLPFNLVVNLTQTRGAEKMFDIMNAHNNFEDALDEVKKMEEFQRAKEIFDSEFKEIEFSRKTYQDIKLNIYWVRTKFKHIRIYVDYITYLSSGTQIFILNEQTRFKFSLRTSLKINLVTIINNLKKEFPNLSGGGHKQACGAMLVGENVEDFLNSFIDEYRSATGAKSFKPAF